MQLEVVSDLRDLVWSWVREADPSHTVGARLSVGGTLAVPVDDLVNGHTCTVPALALVARARDAGQGHA
jgi:hypothetical protein